MKLLNRTLILGALAAVCAGAGVAMAASPWTQWHPHDGETALSSAGTQCYFCPQPKPQPEPVKAQAPGDADGDGITDDKDQCPNTPKGATVNDKGCWVVKGLNFDTAKSVIKPQYTANLDQVVAVLKNNPDVSAEVGGHTDNVGAKDKNMKLSDRRAAAVKAYLIKSGIAANRLSSKGYGQDKPVDSNDNEAGRANNRRVELQTSRK